MSFAARLASGEPIDDPVAVVVAHADDETLWAGAALPRLRDCRLIHVTDSSPRDLSNARAYGLESRAGYARLRATELDAALAELGVTPERIGYGFADQEVVEHLPELVERLTADCRDMAAIVTHSYEGGHPDHDAIALAVRVAAGRLPSRPEIAEFACYAEFDGERVFGRFWPDPDHPEQVRPLPVVERGMVERALGAHASQRTVFEDYLPDAERWRDAPTYDFIRPPPPGRALYDRFGWTITSERWRERARALLGTPA